MIVFPNLKFWIIRHCRYQFYLVVKLETQTDTYQQIAQCYYHQHPAQTGLVSNTLMNRAIRCGHLKTRNNKCKHNQPSAAMGIPGMEQTKLSTTKYMKLTNGRQFVQEEQGVYTIYKRNNRGPIVNPFTSYFETDFKTCMECELL